MMNPSPLYHQSGVTRGIVWLTYIGLVTKVIVSPMQTGFGCHKIARMLYLLHCYTSNTEPDQKFIDSIRQIPIVIILSSIAAFADFWITFLRQQQKNEAFLIKTGAILGSGESNPQFDDEKKVANTPVRIKRENFTVCQESVFQILRFSFVSSFFISALATGFLSYKGLPYFIYKNLPVPEGEYGNLISVISIILALGNGLAWFVLNADELANNIDGVCIRYTNNLFPNPDDYFPAWCTRTPGLNSLSVFATFLAQQFSKDHVWDTLLTTGSSAAVFCAFFFNLNNVDYGNLSLGLAVAGAVGILWNNLSTRLPSAQEVRLLDFFTQWNLYKYKTHHRVINKEFDPQDTLTPYHISSKRNLPFNNCLWRWGTLCYFIFFALAHYNNLTELLSTLNSSLSTGLTFAGSDGPKMTLGLFFTIGILFTIPQVILNISFKYLKALEYGLPGCFKVHHYIWNTLMYILCLCRPLSRCILTPADYPENPELRDEIQKAVNAKTHSSRQPAHHSAPLSINEDPEYCEDTPAADSPQQDQNSHVFLRIFSMCFDGDGSTSDEHIPLNPEDPRANLTYTRSLRNIERAYDITLV